MQVFRISSCKYINDLSGTGASTFGGRWNSKGVYLLYTSSTSSLALLEILVHGINLNADYCIITLSIPDELVFDLSENDLPADWQAFPFSRTTQAIGDIFISENQHLAMSVPSAVNSIEKNIMINPKHPDFMKVKVITTRNLGIDVRLKNQSS